jgi:lysophospholipase L1-like esterase
MLIDVMDVYAGKYLSVFGDSISTFGGVSNNTEFNDTIGSNAVYYSGTNCGVTSADQTYWGRFVNETLARLCVNNSWSGDALRSLRFLDRAVNLHRNTTEEPVNPDLIFVYFGINDIWSSGSTPSRPGGNLNDLIQVRGNKPVEQVIEDWFAGVLDKYEKNDIGGCAWDEYYALMLHLMTTAYPDAKIVCVGLTLNNADNYKNDTAFVPDYNETIVNLSGHFNTVYVDQMSAINESNYDKYMGDGARLHPNAAGREVIFKEIVKALYYDIKKN